MVNIKLIERKYLNENKWLYQNIYILMYIDMQ